MFEHEFFEAVRKNNYDTVWGMISGQLIQNQYMNVNIIENEETPLTHAIKNGYDKIAHCLIDHGADFNTPNANGYSPLDLAEHSIHNTIRTLVSKLRTMGAKNLKVNITSTIDKQILLQKFQENLQIGLQKPEFSKVKQHYNQVIISLQDALNKISGPQINPENIISLKDNFSQALAELVKKNTDWAASNFSAVKRPSNHVAPIVAEEAKLILENCMKDIIKKPSTLLQYEAKTTQSTTSSYRTRTQVMAETDSIMQAQQYTLSNGKIITIDPAINKKMQTETCIFRDEEPAFTNIPQLEEKYRQYSKTTVDVMDSDVFDTAQLLQKQGYNAVTLDLAHARSPGGGARSEAAAQEESLYRRCNYDLALNPTKNPTLKAELDSMNNVSISKLGKPRKETKYKIPVYGAIYTPQVCVFRKGKHENDELMEPFYVNMIAAAAHCPYESGHKLKKDAQAFRQSTEKKIRAILRVAAIKGHDALVLGALGCGAFTMDGMIKQETDGSPFSTTTAVAECFRNVLKEDEFKGAFKHVAFAIFGSKMAQTFLNILPKEVLGKTNTLKA